CVFVSDVPFVSNNLNDIKNQAGVFAYHLTTVGTSITISVGRSGRYVRVQLDGAGQREFSLAEVQVWGN
ncbi:MAG TPA: hypothetical protein VK747_08130, partial [Blastocatellia bacterium]|nr:hypothetical protein [Blastocatellia bacterium]